MATILSELSRVMRRSVLPRTVQSAWKQFHMSSPLAFVTENVPLCPHEGQFILRDSPSKRPMDSTYSFTCIIFPPVRKSDNATLNETDNAVKQKTDNISKKKSDNPSQRNKYVIQSDQPLPGVHPHTALNVISTQ